MCEISTPDWTVSTLIGYSQVQSPGFCYVDGVCFSYKGLQFGEYHETLLPL